MQTSQQPQYQLLQRLGSGTYGDVWRAQDTVTGNIVALKRIKPQKGEEGVPATALREISILLEMSHPNVVKLHHVLRQVTPLLTP